MLYLHKTSYFTCLFILRKRFCSLGLDLTSTCRKSWLCFLCTKLQGCRCPSAPIGGQQGPGRGGGVAEGTRNDRTTTKQPRAQSSEERETEKGSKQTPVLKDPEKRCGFCFYKRKIFLHVYFILPYKDLSKWVRSPLHHMTALVYSSHPIHCYVPSEKPSLNTRTQLCLRK